MTTSDLDPDALEEMSHRAMCAWNGWEPSDKTREIFNGIWTREAPESRKAWTRVVLATINAYRALTAREPGGGAYQGEGE